MNTDECIRMYKKSNCRKIGNLRKFGNLVIWWDNSITIASPKNRNGTEWEGGPGNKKGHITCEYIGLGIDSIALCICFTYNIEY